MRRGYSFGQFFSLLAQLKDHPLYAFMNGLFDEHEQEADIDLFPIRENQARTRWATGGVK